MLFCDIRGYTAFAERHDPEAVVEVLNLYFQHQADIVAKHHGDVDKFVGDQIVAVFQDEEMERNAVRCALEIQSATDELGREHPDWDLEVGIGINTGEVIMGAMGSKNRMDYTVARRRREPCGPPLLARRSGTDPADRRAPMRRSPTAPSLRPRR